ncbi:WG repeat-containing protein [Planctomycetota bacterium]|nr:WG repeat-containing protein [Planctomycetota bacterium]
MQSKLSLIIMLCALLSSALWAQESTQAEPIFGSKFVGDGAYRNTAEWDDEFYPININNKWGYINQKGEITIFPEYDWADKQHASIMRVIVGGRTGFITYNTNNHQVEWLIQPIYAWADHFAEGSAIISDGNKFGFINRFGSETTPLELDGALRYREGLAAFQKGTRIGYINSAGKVVISAKFDMARSFAENVAVARETTRQSRSLGYINRKGEFVFKIENDQFDKLTSFSSHLAAVCKDNQWGYINNKFETAIKPQFEDARPFHSNLAAVKSKGKWGYIDKEGKFIIEPAFDEAYDFQEVLAMIKINKKYGFIDREGKIIIEPQFNEASPYYFDSARVSQFPNFGYIDIKGNVIWDPRAPQDGIFNLKENKKRMTPPTKKTQSSIPYKPDLKYDDALPIEQDNSKSNSRSRNKRRRR